MSIARAKTIFWSDFSEYRVAEFMSKLRLTPTGCMEYSNSERVKGYACIEMRGRTARSHRRCLAHRAVYALTWGKCPGSQIVRHTCDNAKCVNPTHLVLGSQTQNMQDMVSRGRHWTQQRRGQPRKKGALP